MNWLLVSTAAQLILGISAVFDKALLRRNFFDPWVYTFWAGILGIFVIVLAPFGFSSIPLHVIGLALVGGALFMVAVLFFFLALNKGEASVALPVIGGLAPLFTLLVATLALKNQLGGGELIGFLFLVVGGIILLGVEKRGDRLSIFLLAFTSALLFGVSNVITKLVFDATSSFVTGMVWLRVGGLVVLLLLFSPFFRSRVVASARGGQRTNQLLYLLNRGCAALGTVILSGAFYLAHPALVDASSSLKYVVIFLGAWLLLRERFRGWVLVVKICATLLIAVGLAWLALVSYVDSVPIPAQPMWGITFSQHMSERLDLNWRDTYRNVLDDLRPHALRLIAYWNLVEPIDNEWRFGDLDWQLDEAARRNLPVILTVGQKVPRWPECHYPDWLDMGDKSRREEELLEYIRAIVEHYRNYPNLLYWQVENEPFLLFGECPPADAAFIDREIALVKQLDPHHQILVTDGGEFGDWYRAMKRSDVFGTTLYRKVYNRYFGHITYPIPPELYFIRAKLTGQLAGKPSQKSIVIELGLEPWTKKQIYEIPLEEQLRLFSVADFKRTIQYARETRFDIYYLWGVEWWYWLKTAEGDDRLWNAARELVGSR